MKRFLASLLLLAIVVLASCTPAITPVTERDNEEVVISFIPTIDVYSVTVSVLNAATEDPRCGVLNEGRDLGCIIGDVPGGELVTLVVTGAPGEVYCNITASLTPVMTATSLRFYPCQ